MGDTEITLKSLQRGARRPGDAHRDLRERRRREPRGSADARQWHRRTHPRAGGFARRSPRCFTPARGANDSNCSKPTPTCRWPRSISTRPRSRRRRTRRQELRRVEVECIHADPGALSPWVEQCAPQRSCSRWKPPSSAPASRSRDSPLPRRRSWAAPRSRRQQPFADAQLATLRRYFAAALSPRKPRCAPVP